MIIFGVIQAKESTYLETTAIVINFQSYTNSEGRTSYFPVYGYELDGTIYETRSSVGSSSGSGLKKGDTVTIFVNPENYNDILAKGQFNFLLIIGMFFFAVGTLALGTTFEKVGSTFITLGFAFAFLTFGIGVPWLMVGELKVTNIFEVFVAMPPFIILIGFDLLAFYFIIAEASSWISYGIKKKKYNKLVKAYNLQAPYNPKTITKRK